MSDKPNVLIIWGDDIGQSNLSCYSNGLMGYRTPNIDRVAAEGVLFTDYYAEQSCTAGRAAFITGQNPYRTGLTKVGLPGAASYCASKGGVALFTKAAALELAPLGVRVNSVHPGFIETPMVMNALRESENENERRDMIVSRHAMLRLGVPREIADAIVFLASDESSFMTGSEMVVDGGYTAA